MSYEKLMKEYPHITVKEVKKMPKGLSGLYYDNVIHINKQVSYFEKHMVLAEELGHHVTTHGDITNLSDVRNKKLECIARRWAYEKVLSLDKMIDLFNKNHLTVEDLCTDLEITPENLKTILDNYLARYGLSVVYKSYLISFDPLNIRKVDA